MRTALKLAVTCLWLAVLALPVGALNLTLKVDITAAESFFSVVDRLKAGTEPASAEWDVLFSTPAYTALTRQEIPREAFMGFVRVAFLPSEAEALAKLHEDDAPALMIVDHLIKADGNRAEIRAFLADVSANFPALTDAAARLLTPYVPADGAKEAMTVPVAFALFANDARGYPGQVVFDALFALEAGDSLKFWLAHELHHFYRHARTLKAAALIPGDEAVYWTLGQLQSEGIADLIDKQALFYGEGYMARTRMADYFRRNVEEGPAAIESLSELLAAYGEIGDGREMLAEDIRKAAPMAGHPTGYFMAGLIERELGRDKLVEAMADPFAFIKLYNKAAGKAGQPQFMSKARATLKRLEKALR